MAELLERRKHKRFSVQDGAFAVFKPQWRDSAMSGKLVDISKDGLSFLYAASEDRSNGPFELSILLAYHGFYFENVPVKTISDLQVAEDAHGSSMATRRRGVQFAELTQEQMSLLDYFISNHTVGEV